MVYLPTFTSKTTQICIVGKETTRSIQATHLKCWIEKMLIDFWGPKKTTLIFFHLGRVVCFCDELKWESWMGHLPSFFDFQGANEQLFRVSFGTSGVIQWDPFGRDQTRQMYGAFDGFPLSIGWYYDDPCSCQPKMLLHWHYQVDKDFLIGWKQQVTQYQNLRSDPVGTRGSGRKFQHIQPD